ARSWATAEPAARSNTAIREKYFRERFIRFTSRHTIPSERARGKSSQYGSYRTYFLNAISMRSEFLLFLLSQIWRPVSAVSQICASAYCSPCFSKTSLSTAFGSLDVLVIGAFRITLDLPSSLR